MSQKLQKTSYRNPNGLRADSPGSPGRGMGTGSGSSFSQKSRTREEREIWVAEHLPGENYHAAIAVKTRLELAGKTADVEAIRKGLEKRGWLKEQA